MKTVHSPLHAGHAGQLELTAGRLLPGFEVPERAEIIKARIEAVGLGPILAPTAQTLDVATRVHRPDYVDFLARAWDLWIAAGYEGPALPFVWPTRGLRDDLRPDKITALLGYYSFDGGSAFVAGTWGAIESSYAAALTAADLVASGERGAYALCRPPGHHAGVRAAGGYCYLNNAACAATRLRDAGAARVAILDVDFHHGNGTQEIFWTRGDVAVVNLHGDPATEYPYFLGAADERGVGPGEGFNLNLPMAAGADWAIWGEALTTGLSAIRAWGVDALVVSLGVDTWEGDPISHFRLKTSDYPRIGAAIAALGLPTVFVQEGGYAVAAIGDNAVGVLEGFEGR
ncbi:histone deacetylase family protein [Siculibacillus lacustris]|uniref:Histone deacetylase family protein n=1 Tax=Siculibacillus lacustris TaxID=1549641 RepID=A0A4Q9VQB7_9HYPH|nr:histone deacetylase family protein [Siculibacillus lacustris]TBW38006.1 histone deacetylase family protein [Siculibacillus lacustris]